MEITLDTCFWAPDFSIVMFYVEKIQSILQAAKLAPNPQSHEYSVWNLLFAVPWDLLCAARLLGQVFLQWNPFTHA